MNAKQILFGICAYCLTAMSQLQAQTPVDIDAMAQDVTAVCPSVWEDLKSDLDPGAIAGDVWQGNTPDKDAFKAFIQQAMGTNAPNDSGLEAMAGDVSTVATECATHRLRLLDALIAKVPKDVLTALDAVSGALSGGGLGSFAAVGGGRPYGLVVKNLDDHRIQVTAKRIGLDQGAFPVGVSDVDVMLDLTVVGKLGLDTGAEAADTWYYLFVAKDASDQSIGGFLSASFDAPVVPNDYSAFAFVGAVRNDATGNFLNFVQHGDRVRYTERYELPQTVDSTNFVPVQVSALVPTTTGMIAEVGVGQRALADQNRIAYSYDGVNTIEHNTAQHAPRSDAKTGVFTYSAYSTGAAMVSVNEGAIYCKGLHSGRPMKISVMAYYWNW